MWKIYWFGVKFKIEHHSITTRSKNGMNNQRSWNGILHVPVFLTKTILPLTRRVLNNNRNCQYHKTWSYELHFTSLHSTRPQTGYIDAHSITITQIHAATANNAIFIVVRNLNSLTSPAHIQCNFSEITIWRLWLQNNGWVFVVCYVLMSV